MNKREEERSYKQDLARYLKTNFEEYESYKDVANKAFKRTQQRQNWDNYHKDKDIAIYQEYNDKADDIQAEIESLLPDRNLFNSVYIFYGKLKRANELDAEITNERVLSFINGDKVPNEIEDGKLFTSVRCPHNIYRILSVDKDKVYYDCLNVNKSFLPKSIKDFKDALDSKKINFIEKAIQMEIEDFYKGDI